jgi:hypothetical protein
MRDHGKIELSDEQFKLFFEIFYAFFSLNQESVNKLRSTEEVQKFRKNICLGCSQFEDKIDQHTCKLCGCNLDYKVTSPTEACPEGKWTNDLEPIRKELKNLIDYLNSQIDTGFYNQPTLEEIEEKYRKIIESGEKHE